MSVKKQKNNTLKKRVLLTSSLLLPVFFILELIALVTPTVSGFAAYPLKTLQCGHPPYIANSFAAGYSYTKPGDGNYQGPDTLTQPGDFYCSEPEVQKAGYRPDIWGEEPCRSYPQGKTYCAVGDDGFDIIIGYVGSLIIVSGLLSYVIALIILKKRT